MNSASGIVFAARLHRHARKEPAVERADHGTIANEGQRIAERDPEN
jgi:hypothetical protein